MPMFKKRSKEKGDAAKSKGKPMEASVSEKKRVFSKVGKASMSFTATRSWATVMSFAEEEEDVNFEWSDIVGSCKRLVRESMRWCIRGPRSAAAALGNEIRDIAGGTNTAKAITNIRRGGTKRKGLGQTLANRMRLIKSLFSGGSLANDKIQHVRTRELQATAEDDPAFGVHALVIHNSGKLQDWYHLEDEQLGQGGSAIVYKAIEQFTKVERAIKRVSKRIDPSEYKRLANEVKVMKSLDHPNIAKLFETFEDDRALYLVLELCEGGDLFDYLVENGPLSEFYAAVVVRIILTTTNYCHMSGFCHRDIKPENVLFKDRSQHITASGIRLIDFGYACPIPEENQKLTTKVGSPYYVAPEVLAGSYDQRCDLWSAGVVCYMLLSGYPPFSGLTDAATLNKVREGKFVFHRHRWMTVSKPAKHLIRKLLEVDPEKRISVQTALEHTWIKGRGVTRIGKMREETVDRLITFHQHHVLRKAAMLAVSFQLEEKDVSSIQALFHGFDLNGDGLLTADEFMQSVQSCGVEEAFVQEMMRSVDADGSGVIDYCEFLSATLEKEMYIKNHAAMLRAFRCFDQDGSGGLSLDEIIDFLRLTKADEIQQVKDVFAQFDTDGEMILDYGEFFSMLTYEIKVNHEYVEDENDMALRQLDAEGRSKGSKSPTGSRTPVGSSPREKSSPRSGHSGEQAREKSSPRQAGQGDEAAATDTAPSPGAGAAASAAPGANASLTSLTSALRQPKSKLPEGTRASGKTVSFAESASELELSSDESEVQDVEEGSSSEDDSGSDEEDSSDEG